MVLNTRKEIGNAALSTAIAYFGSNGYIVSIPLNDTQDYDLVFEVLQKLCVRFDSEAPKAVTKNNVQCG